MKTALALGTFDGVHIAHRKVLDLPEGYKKTAITFKKPPKMYFDGKEELIMSFSDKVESLGKLGFSQIIALDFGKVRDVSPLEFLEFLRDEYKPSFISCGFNYRFGKNGEGDTAFLADFCQKNGIELNVCDAVCYNGKTISSTYVRNLLKDGEIEKSNRLTFKPFSFTGIVIKGNERGRTIGFPTINVKYPQELVKVKFGVYKSKIEVEGKTYYGITNVGVRPTVGSDYVTSETFIKRFSGDMYGKIVQITLKQFLREEKKFASLEELKKQIEIDITK